MACEDVKACVYAGCGSHRQADWSTAESKQGRCSIGGSVNYGTGEGWGETYRDDGRTLYRSKIYRYLFLPCKNRRSMQVFDSITVLQEEQERQLRLGYFVIHPCSRFKLNWDIVIVLVLAINMVVLPIELAFFPKEQTAVWMVFNLSSSLVFAIDMFMNFCSGVITTNNIHLDRVYLAARYMRRWFIIDLFGTIPFDNIMALFHLERQARLGKISTILGTLKLLRVVSLVRHVIQWQEVYVDLTHRKYIKLANIVVSILLLCHFNGCLLYFVPMCQNFPPGSWVHKSDMMLKGWFDKYVWCLFSALSLMISVGFGAVNLERTEEVILCCFVLLSGTVGFGVLLANGTAIVQSFNLTKRAHERIMSEVNEYMDYKKLPPMLRHRITDYFENRYRGRYFDESKILSELSENLRADLLHHSCHSLIKEVPFFKAADAAFVNDLIRRLQSEFYQPGDTIITAGTIGSKMYFLQNGNVAVILQDGQVVAHLKDGAYFGEMGLLLQERRSAYIVAEAHCTVYSLSHADFNELLLYYPDVKEELMREVHQRQTANRLLTQRCASSRSDPSIAVTIESDERSQV